MIVERHRKLAKAFVALAREHGMNGLLLKFRVDRSSDELPPRAYEQVSMSWSQGRHGGKGRIQMTTEASEDFEEGE